VNKRTPQEKKRLSYARDHRNTFGENDKASRKAIPRRKRGVVRAYRRVTDQLLPRGDVALDGETVEAAELSVREVRRKSWRKWPDTPLGEYVEQQRERRLQRGGRKGYRQAEAQVQRLLRERCLASPVLKAEDVVYEPASTPAMDSERRGTTLVLLHTPTSVKVRAGYELPSGLSAAEYRAAIARAVSEAFEKLEAEVSRRP
jgi:hypothetical protein